MFCGSAMGGESSPCWESESSRGEVGARKRRPSSGRLQSMVIQVASVVASVVRPLPVVAFEAGEDLRVDLSDTAYGEVQRLADLLQCHRLTEIHVGDEPL